MDDRKGQWEVSYQNRQNFVFYPCEELIRFVARYLRKRVGLDQYEDRHAFGRPPRWLDLGCGIGRHVVYGHEAGMDVHGIDLSANAVAMARQWAARAGVSDTEKRICQGSADALPWPDGHFDVVISHGVLDSMPFAIAQKAVGEVQRVLAKGGLFYCDLISGDDSAHAREFAGEQVVSIEHEKDTIQSYFNFARIQQLFANRLELLECQLVQRTDVLKGPFIGRYHLVLRKTQ
jgi:ubiquinone/menaquinone biosynthesis C-methylase UbiE